MSKQVRFLAACLAASPQMGCNTGDLNLVAPNVVASPGPPLNFSPEIAVSPPTVPAQTSTSSGFQWELALEVSLRDVARRGIRVDEARIQVNTLSGERVFDASLRDLVPDFQNSVPVGATARWVVRGVRYNLPGGGRSARGNVYFEMETGVGDFRTMNFGFPIS